MGTFVGASSNGGNLTALTTGNSAPVTWPAGVQSGDLAILWWVWGTSAVTATDPTSDAFTLVGNTDDGNCRTRLLKRVCNGSESGSLSGWSTSLQNRQTAVLFVVRGYSDVAAAVFRAEPGTSTSHDCPAIATSDGALAGDALLVLAADRAGSVTPITPPAGFSKRTNSEFAASGSGGSLAVIADDGLTDSATLPTDPAAFTGFTSGGAAVTATIALRPEVTAVDLTVSSATHAQTAESPTLTQVHSLTVAGATQGHTAQSPALTQTHQLTVAGATQAHTADSPALTQTHSLSVASAMHVQTADAPALTQTHVLTVQDAAHAQTADQVTLSVTTDLVVDDAIQAHSATSVELTQTHVLEVDSALHLQTATSVTITLTAEREDVTITVGPTRLGTLSAGPTRRSLTAGATRGNTSKAGPTRTSTAIGPTRRDRGA